MTTEEDLLFKDIMDSVRDLDLTGDEKAEELMEKFAILYKEEYIDKKSEKVNPVIEKAVQDWIPEYFI